MNCPLRSELFRSEKVFDLVFVYHLFFKRVFAGFGMFDAFDDFDEVTTRPCVGRTLTDPCVF